MTPPRWTAAPLDGVEGAWTLERPGCPRRGLYASRERAEYAAANLNARLDPQDRMSRDNPPPRGGSK